MFCFGNVNRLRQPNQETQCHFASSLEFSQILGEGRVDEGMATAGCRGDGVIACGRQLPMAFEDWPSYTGMPTIHLQKTFEDEKLGDFKILNNLIQRETVT